MSTSATSVALTGTDQVIAAGPAIYRGFTLRETAGAAAVVRVYDSPSAASGTLLDTIALTANGSAQELYAGGGVRAGIGIYVDIVSGAVEGSLRVG